MSSMVMYGQTILKITEGISHPGELFISHVNTLQSNGGIIEIYDEVPISINTCDSQTNQNQACPGLITNSTFLVINGTAYDHVHIPSNIKLQFFNNGKLNIAPGTRVLMDAEIIAPRKQIFKGGGATLLKRQVTQANQILPEWWGAKTGDPINDHISLNAVKNFLEYSNGGTIEISGRFVSNSDLTFSDNIELKFNNGGLLAMASGTTLTINGIVNAGLHKIFNGSTIVKGKIKAKAIYPQWWGAKTNDGLNDQPAIQSAIESVNSQGLGTVYFPSGTYNIESPIELKSFVTLKGEKPENAWVRIPGTKISDGIYENADIYNTGSHIMVTDNKNCDAITVTAQYGWGLENLIIDGNHHNQDPNKPGKHCLKSSSPSKSAGASIKGCKFVNPMNYGIYFYNQRVVDIRDCAIMSGIFIGASGDVSITGCSIDGTHGKHPAFYLAEVSGANISNNLIWGWGEFSRNEIWTYDNSIPEKVSLKYESIENEPLLSNLEFNHKTEYNDFLYENMPIILEPTNREKIVYNINGYTKYGGRTMYLTKKSTDPIVWEFRNRTTVSNADHKVTIDNLSLPGNYNFNILPGNKSAGLITDCHNMKLTSNRFAGSLRSGLSIYTSSDIVLTANNFTRLNLEDDDVDEYTNQNYVNITTSAIELFDSKNCIVVSNSIGEQGGKPDNEAKKYIKNAISNIDYGIHLSDKFSNWVDASNIIGHNNYLYVKDTYIKDDYIGDYENRNIITHTTTKNSFPNGVTIDVQGTSENFTIPKTKSIVSKWHEDVYYLLDFNNTGNNYIPSGSPLTTIYFNMVNSPFTTNYTIGTTQNEFSKFQINGSSVYRVNGKLSFSDFNNTTTGGKIEVIITYMHNNDPNHSSNFTKSFNVRKQNTGSPEQFLDIPFDFTIPVTDINPNDGALLIQAYHSLGNNINIETANNKSWFSIKKIGDLH